MTILEPSTTPTTRQVWPAPRKTETGEPTPTVLYQDGSPVEIEDVAVGDMLAFWAEDRAFRPVITAGKVTKVNESRGRRVLVLVATKRGVCVLSRKYWEKKAPRR